MFLNVVDGQLTGLLNTYTRVYFKNFRGKAALCLILAYYFFITVLILIVSTLCFALSSDYEFLLTVK